MNQKEPKRTEKNEKNEKNRKKNQNPNISLDNFVLVLRLSKLAS